MRAGRIAGWIRRASVALLLVFAVRPAAANINLELRALPEPCLTHNLLIELYAVSDDQSNQSISAMDVILTWDRNVLQLLGTDNTGPYGYNWLFSGFQNDHNFDGLNDTWADGNALYTAWAQLGGPPAYATPQGLLVVAFKFRKLHVGTNTTVNMPASFGLYTHTVVYDGFVPGLDVTGTLTGVSVVPSSRGDINCDGVVDFADIDPFVLAFSGEAAFHAVYPDCNYFNSDCNCDGSVDFADIDPWVALLSS